MKKIFLAALSLSMFGSYAQDSTGFTNDIDVYVNASLTNTWNPKEVQSTNYNRILAIPFAVEGTDEDLYPSYDLERGSISSGYNVDLIISSHLGTSALVLEGILGFSRFSYFSGRTGPSQYDFDNPSLLIDDRFEIGEFGGAVGFDLLKDPRKGLEILFDYRVISAQRFIDAELKSFRSDEPYENWVINYGGTQYGFKARYSQKFDSGLGFSIGLHYIPRINLNMRDGRRQDLNLGNDYQLKPNASPQWEIEGPESRYLDSEFDKSFSRFLVQVGVVYGF